MCLSLDYVGFKIAYSSSCFRIDILRSGGKLCKLIVTLLRPETEINNTWTLDYAMGSELPKTGAESCAVSPPQRFSFNRP